MKTHVTIPIGPMPAIIASVIILAGVILFSGCATTGVTPTTQNSAVKLTVQYATLKVLNKNPAYAARAATIAGDVRKVASGEASTVDILISLARSQINWDRLDAADTLIVTELLNVISAELKARVGSGPIVGDKALAVAEFASWIEQAAKLSVP